MDKFSYHDGQLFCEGVKVEDIVRQVGTPAYIYSKETILHHYHSLVEAFKELDPLVCYSVKVNSNGAILKRIWDEGSGFDVVSGGELFRALRAGASGERIVFAGVAKTEAEIRMALENDILMFNVESPAELRRISDLAVDMKKNRRHRHSHQP